TPTVRLEGYSSEQIGYHSYLLVDAGLAAGMDGSNLDDVVPQFCLNNLTWEGHEFLDAARDETHWNKTKDMFARVGGFSLPLALEFLLQLMKQKLGASD
ncbi:hypothetical protein LCGC14_2864380, partial [marine sediment metagenome]